MLLLFIGPSTAGKSTAANHIKDILNATVVTGKDYLNKAKNELNAWNLFKKDLGDAITGKSTIIYILTEPEKVDEIKKIGPLSVIKFTAELSVLKQRFSKRTNGTLPPSLEKMLKRQMDTWSNIACDDEIDTGHMTEHEVRKTIENMIKMKIV